MKLLIHMAATMLLYEEMSAGNFYMQLRNT